MIFCPNDLGHPVIGRQFDHSYSINGRIVGQPVDFPTCGTQFGCGRTIRPGDKSWYHYLLVEYPADPYYRRMGHDGGRPFCYLDGSIKWRRSETPKNGGHVPD